MIPIIPVAFGRIALVRKFIQRTVMIRTVKREKINKKEKTNLPSDFKVIKINISDSII